jgi:hypothetical protein
LNRNAQSFGVALVGLALLTGAGSMLWPAALRHEGLRAEWREAAGELHRDDPAYDPGRSDALYAASREELSVVRRSAPIAAGGLLLVLVGLTALLGEGRPLRPVEDANKVQVLLGTVVDGLVGVAGWVGLGAAFYETDPTPLGSAMRSAIPVLALAVVVCPLAVGASPGQALLLTRSRTKLGARPHALQALLAGILLPTAAFFAVAALALPPLRHPALIGPHLTAVGLRTYKLRVRRKPPLRSRGPGA